MRPLKYFIGEASASLWRGRGSAALSILTIAAGLFVLGFFLVVNTNVQRLVVRWSESAELSVYLRDDATPDHLRMVDELIGRSGLSSSHRYVSKADAAGRFRQDFPDLASAAAGQLNPFPASFEVRLTPQATNAGETIDALAATLRGVQGVADIRYDRRWLSRLTSAIRFARGIGLVIITLLIIAAGLTVANVVRLAAYARRDEIEIMQLVGAPLAYVRGPFVVEGVLQGGVGALVAMIGLWLAFVAGRARYGAVVSEALGIGPLTFLPVELWLLLVGGGMLLGCIGGWVVARAVR